MDGTVIYFKRGPRKRRTLPEGEVIIPSYPPEPAEPAKMSPLLLLAPIAGVLVVGLAMAFIYRNFLYPLIIMSGGMIYALVNVLRQREQRKKYQEKLTRVHEAYEKQVRRAEAELEKRKEQQIDYLEATYPPEDAIEKWAAQAEGSLWERRPKDADFLDVCIGVGEGAAAFDIKLPKIEIPDLAPEPLLAAREMAEGFRTLQAVPLISSLAKSSSLALTGPPNLREGLARAILCQIAGLHAPDAVRLYAIYPSHRAAGWDWLKWLPHTHAVQAGGVESGIAYEQRTVRALFSDLLDRLDERELKAQDAIKSDSSPFLVIFVDDPSLIAGEVILERILKQGRECRAAIILLAPNLHEVPEGFDERVSLIQAGQGLLQRTGAGEPVDFTPQFIELEMAERIARNLAPIRLVGRKSTAGLPAEIRLLELEGCPDLNHLNLSDRWLEAQSSPPRLEVLLGMRPGKRPLLVDLKQSGAGPHGLIAGTTGSGKSELLLTLLTSLAIHHHPHQVNFVLIDYKGGTAMSVLEDLSHTVGLVTDLDGRQTRRALVALRSEMERREKILNRYQVADIDKYHQLGLPEPFPYLFIVIDEFAELRDRFRDDLGEVLREFVSVAQKGRALGVHLILAMQKPEGVVNDSIRANMKFRICLRVERLEDSRNVLGRPDAYLLPHQPPGRAYFQVGNDEQFDLFQVARVAGLYRQREAEKVDETPLQIKEVGPDGRRILVLEIETEPRSREAADAEPRTEAKLIVEKARQAAEKLQVDQLDSPWPPPLPEALFLESLIRKMDASRWQGDRWPRAVDQYAVPVGLLDEPVKQRQRPLLLNPETDGNLLVVGAPGSGRTTFLLTYVKSLALRLSPAQIHFHLIDYGGHQLRAAFSDYPHIAGIYEPSQKERIRRLLAALHAELGRRKEAFAEAGVASLRGYRGARPNGEPMPVILTAFHNFIGFYEEFREAMGGWIRQLREGSAYGMNYVLTADSIPTGKIADLISTRLALRLADKTWYGLILGARPDLSTHAPHPGRGFISTKPPLEMQIALPERGTPEEQIAGLKEMGERMGRAWEGPKPAPIRTLSKQVGLAEVLPKNTLEGWPLRDDLQTWIGLDDGKVQPVVLDLTRSGSALLVSSPPEGGRTTALATLALSLAATHDPAKVQMGFVAPKRGGNPLLDPLAGLPHSLGLAGSPQDIEALLTDLEEAAEQREAEQAGCNQGPHLALFIDDYQILAARSDSSLLSRLEELGKRGQDVDLTLFVAVSTLAVSSGGDSFLRWLRSWRAGLWLKSTVGMDAQMAGVSIPARMRGMELPPGRGFLYGPGRQMLMQVASPEIGGDGEEPAPGSVAGWVEAIQASARSRNG